MASADVKILGMWFSPFVLRAKLALNIKEVAFDYQEEVADNKSELLLESNPIYKKVPVLIHNNKPLCESKIIVEYIDEAFDGPSILPSDPLERAQARFWAYYYEDKLLMSFFSIVRTNMNEEDKMQAVEKIISRLKPLEDYLAEKPFFGGDNIGYVDIALGASLSWVKVVEEVENVKVLDGVKLPNLVKWADRFSSNDMVKVVVPDHNKLVEFCKVLQEKVWKSRPAS